MPSLGVYENGKGNHLIDGAHLSQPAYGLAQRICEKPPWATQSKSAF
jgi:hypothetical protein